jgi:hypothetical protein
LIFFFSSSVFLDSFILDTILFNNCSRNCCCHLQLFNKNHLIILNKDNFIQNKQSFTKNLQRIVLKIKWEFDRPEYSWKIACWTLNTNQPTKWEFELKVLFWWTKTYVSPSGFTCPQDSAIDKNNLFELDM